MTFPARLYVEQYQHILCGELQPIDCAYPEAAVSGHTHALTTGWAEDLLNNAASCTVLRVQKRWCACTLIYIRA